MYKLTKINDKSLNNEFYFYEFVLLSCILLISGVFPLLYISGFAQKLRLLFPLFCTFIAILLYKMYPVIYLEFVWWIWFLTPLIRRLLDYKAGWLSINPVMLTPFLVTGISIFSIIKNWRIISRYEYFPFTLPILAIFYGYVIGVLRNGIFVATFDFLQWIVPVLFGLHIFLNWQKYFEFRNSIIRVFTWGLLVISIYGLIQFFLVPKWDAYWMVSCGKGSVSKPIPLTIKIFGPLNSPGPYAYILMLCLLLIFNNYNLKGILFSGFGLIALSLTLVRSAWGAFVLGLIIIFSLKKKGKKNRWIIIGFILCVLVFVKMNQQWFTRIEERIESISEIQDNRSFRSRIALYYNQTIPVLTNPIGDGIGSTGKAQKLNEGSGLSFDSGILTLAKQLGWPGLCLYICGIYFVIVQILRNIYITQIDQFYLSSMVIILLALILMIFSNFLIAVKGTVLWCFIGILFGAGRIYSENYFKKVDN